MMVHRSGPAVGVPKIQPTVATSASAPQVGEQVVLLNCNFVHRIYITLRINNSYALFQCQNQCKPPVIDATVLHWLRKLHILNK